MKRIDIIGQNGNDGLHYNREGDSMSALDNQVDGTHYSKLKIQPVEYIHANNLGFLEGSVIKYVTRWRDKNGVVDLKKAKHFIELLIELERDKSKVLSEDDSKLTDKEISFIMGREEPRSIENSPRYLRAAMFKEEVRRLPRFHLTDDSVCVLFTDDKDFVFHCRYSYEYTKCWSKSPGGKDAIQQAFEKWLKHKGC